MRVILIVMALLFSVIATAQTTQCVEVPKDHKVVFVPWFIPVGELVWKWHPASEPEVAEVPFDYSMCEGLVISPNIRDPRCDEPST